MKKQPITSCDRMDEEKPYSETTLVTGPPSKLNSIENAVVETSITLRRKEPELPSEVEEELKEIYNKLDSFSLGDSAEEKTNTPTVPERESIKETTTPTVPKRKRDNSPLAESFLTFMSEPDAKKVIRKEPDAKKVIREEKKDDVKPR